jgi:hypothetical protein
MADVFGACFALRVARSGSRGLGATLLVRALWGCSGNDSSGTGGGPSGSGGTPSSGGVSGSGGASDPSTGCPDTIPALGDACSGLQTCDYDDCAGMGHVSALCNQSQISSWKTAACTATPCGDTSCDPGAVCVVELSNDTSTARCVNDPCGSGPTGCEYACYANLCAPGLMCYSATADFHRTVNCQAP